MPLKRLKIALDEGLLALPDLCVLNAPGDLAIDARASQTFYPAYKSLQLRGIDVSPLPLGPFKSVVIQCHRARAVTYDLLRQAILGSSEGQVIAVNGDKTDGIEAITRELKKRFDNVEVFSKAHGKLVWFTRPNAVPEMIDWEARSFDLSDDFKSHPGIFSSDRPDKGSTLLAEQLPPLKGKVADLGSGWGYLSRAILTSEHVTHLDMIEADYQACEMAKLNVTDPRAHHHWDDATTFSGKDFDTVVMNPPFHTSRKAEPALGQSFIRCASAMLGARGSLWMVANRNLPYEAVLDESFQVVNTVAQTGGFKIVHAQRPKTSRKPR